MAIKNIANTAHLFVQDTTTGLGKTALSISGDFTSIKLNQDGNLSDNKIPSISGSFVEDGAGFYSFNLPLADMNYKSILPIAVMSNSNYQAFGYAIYTENGSLATIDSEVVTISGFVDNLPTIESTLNTVSNNVLTVSGFVDDIPTLNTNILIISGYVDNIPTIQTQTDKITHIETGVVSITGSLNTNLDAKISSRSVPGDMMNLSGTATSAKLVDDIWDEVLTGATHNVPTSSGRRLRQLASQVVHEGIAQGSGVNGNQIILDTGASSVNGSYDPSLIAIVGGTGTGQCRLILQYEGSTRTATVDRTWKTNPSTDSEFIIYAHPGREHVNEGLAISGSSNTIRLNANASTYDDKYCGQIVFIRSGMGEDQCRLVIDYNGSNQTATVDHAWDQIPDTTSAYVMLPNHIHETVTLDASQPFYAPSLQTTLLSVSGDVSNIETNVLALSGTLEDIQVQISGSSAPTVEEIRFEIDNYSIKLDATYNNTNNILESVSSLPTKEQIRTEMDSNSTKLSSINSNVIIVSGYTDDIPNINSNVLSISSNVNTVSNNLLIVSGYTDNLPTIETKINTLQSDVTSISGTLNTVSNNVLSISSDVDNLQVSVASIITGLNYIAGATYGKKWISVNNDIVKIYDNDMNLLKTLTRSIDISGNKEWIPS